MDLRRVAWLAGLGLFAFACGQEFSPIDPNVAGASGSASGGSGSGGGGATVAGGASGGDDATDGGAEAAGAGAGDASGGRGGVSNVAGSGGKMTSAGSGGRGGSAAGTGGSGGSAVVEVPPVPTEGLELWLDANTGVTKATSGAVSLWKDRSGNKHDALQTAVNYQPKLASLENGKATISFDGEDDYLKLASLPGDFSKGVSIFTVSQQDADDGTCTAVFEASNGPEIDDVHLGLWQSALQYEVAAEYLHATEQPLILGAPQLLAVVHQTSNRMQLRRNSSALGEAFFALPTTSVRTDVFIGRSDYKDCTTYDGSVSELLVYKRAVSDAELLEIETYLQKKWACCED